MEKTKGQNTSLMKLPVKEKIKALLKKISKKLKQFVPPMSQPDPPSREEEIDAYIVSLEDYRDSLKDIQELERDFIELNMLLADELPNLEPAERKLFRHQAHFLSEVFKFKLEEAEIESQIAMIIKAIEQAKAFIGQ